MGCCWCCCWWIMLMLVLLRFLLLLLLLPAIGCCCHCCCYYCFCYYCCYHFSCCCCCCSIFVIVYVAFVAVVVAIYAVKSNPKFTPLPGESIMMSFVDTVVNCFRTKPMDSRKWYWKLDSNRSPCTASLGRVSDAFPSNLTIRLIQCHSPMNFIVFLMQRYNWWRPKLGTSEIPIMPLVDGDAVPGWTYRLMNWIKTIHLNNRAMSTKVV